MQYDIQKVTDYLWELPKAGGMRVPARIYATEAMLPQLLGDNAPQPAANVAHLPGVVRHHWRCRISIGATGFGSGAWPRLNSTPALFRLAVLATISTAASD
jgi:hypothetical protein